MTVDLNVCCRHDVCFALRRFQQFGNIFSKAMRRNDGEIFEDLLVAAVNSANDPARGLKSFSEEEVLRFTSQLVCREKVYHSEGVYYDI
jgi:hypothetical protein